jgi:hypothetical protein
MIAQAAAAESSSRIGRKLFPPHLGERVCGRAPLLHPHALLP